MSKRVPLRETAVVTLNGAGAGTARVGPLSAREVWYPDNVAIKANANPINDARCSVYMGENTSQSNFRDESMQGSSGDSTGACSGDVVKSNSYIWAVWSSGDVFVQATLTVTGVKDV